MVLWGTQLELECAFGPEGIVFTVNGLPPLALMLAAEGLLHCEWIVDVFLDYC